MIASIGEIVQATNAELITKAEAKEAVKVILDWQKLNLSKTFPEWPGRA